MENNYLYKYGVINASGWYCSTCGVHAPNGAPHVCPHYNNFVIEKIESKRRGNES